MRIGRDTLDFRPEPERAFPARRAIDGIDRAFLFRNARLPLLAPGGVQPLPVLTPVILS